MKFLGATLTLTLAGLSQAMDVQTSSGHIKGHSLEQYPDVEEFLGIPFAKSPVGDLRFAAPQKYESTQEFVADKYGYSCIQLPATVNSSQPENWQNIARSQSQYTNHMSEDCLNLNVWVSKNGDDSCPGSSLKPVLMYFFGGGFHSGSGNDEHYNGAAFAQEQDIILVTFNYRLGIFGFSGAPGLTQNVALLDQRLAVEWVRDNIRAFGGDPKKITIFGHSAGGASVDFYDFAFYKDPIISGVIPMSGSVNSFGRRLSNTSEAGWSETAKALACGSAKTEAEITACMRKANPTDLLTASLKATKVVAAELDKLGKLYAGITGLFGPTIDNKTVFANYTERVAAGKISKVPTIVGFNTDEGCFFAEEGSIPSSYKTQLAVTEIVFSCPLHWGAVWRASAGIPAWKYLYEGAYPNLYAPACPGKPWHGQEIYVIFNSSESATKYPATKPELAGGKYMRTAFSTFVKNPSQGLVSKKSPVQWPMFNDKKAEVVSLGGNSTFEQVKSDAIWIAPCYTHLRDGAPNF